MLRRVSSRPRLVSDADCAFQNATVEVEDAGSDFFGDNEDGGRYAVDGGVGYIVDEAGSGAAYGSVGEGLMDHGSNDGGSHSAQSAASLMPSSQPRLVGFYTEKDINGDAAAVSTSAVGPISIDASESSHDDMKLLASSNHHHHSNSNNSSHALTKTTSFDDDDDLSDYASCIDSMSRSTSLANILPRNDVSLTNLNSFRGGGGGMMMMMVDSLEDGLKKASLASFDEVEETTRSSGDDQSKMQQPTIGGLCINTNLSTKRKRLSNYYMTPTSSYASLNSHNNGYPSILYHPLCGVSALYDESYSENVHHHKSEEKEYEATPSLLQLLPEESLLSIAFFLSARDIRSLSTSNHFIRATLMSSQGAVEGIWMKELKRNFGGAFCRLGVNGEENWMSSQDVELVDDLHLSLIGVADFSEDCGGTTGVNLPLLTGLLPQRYPQCIDPNTLNVGAERHVFKSYNLAVAASDVMGSDSKGEDNNESDKDGDQKMPTVVRNEPSLVIPVVQFTGRVGNGDRCIKSNKPFPPSCKVLESVGPSGGKFRRLSTLLRERAHRSKRETIAAGRRSLTGGGRGVNMSNNAFVDPPSAVTPFNLITPIPNSETNHPAGVASFTTPAVVSQAQVSPPQPPHRSIALPVSPSLNSPLYRFLSSLSHRCDSGSASSSFYDNGEDGDEGGIISSFYDGEEETADGNEIGIITKGLNKCKSQLERLRPGYVKRRTTNLKPFVVPRVVAHVSCSEGKKVVVDMTPSLVAYFEVTILNQAPVSSEEDDSAPLPRRTNTQRAIPANILAPRALPRRQHFALHNRHIMHEQPLPRHMNNWRMPHRVPMHPLVAMAINQDHWMLHQEEVHHQLPPPPFVRRNGNQADERHECVAIGLSTNLFSSKDRMPGWDHQSFGYHSDDGGIFHGQGDMIRRYGPSFGPGDCVGCGLEYSTRRIFFVRNGEFLGYAFDKVSEEMIDRGLSPTVGVDTEHPLFVNFGEQSFRFDLRTFVRDRCGITEDEKKVSVSGIVEQERGG